MYICAFYVREEMCKSQTKQVELSDTWHYPTKLQVSSWYFKILQLFVCVWGASTYRCFRPTASDSFSVYISNSSCNWSNIFFCFPFGTWATNNKTMIRTHHIQLICFEIRTHASRQRYRHEDMKTWRHEDMKTDTQTHKHTDRHEDRQTETLTDRPIQTYILTDIHTDRQAHRDRKKHINT